MAPIKAKFSEGEKVLCFHGPLIYEAKCLKVETKPQLRYFIHYNGWNKNWDEWVPETRVLKCDNAGYQKQKEMQKAHMSAKASKKSKAQAAKKVEKKEKPEKPRTPVNVEKKEKALSSASRSRSGRGGGGDTTPRSSTPVHSAPATPVAITSASLSSSTTSTASQDVSEPKKKRARGETILPGTGTVELEETFQTKVEVRIKIPETLKPWIVDDWDMITRQFRLVHLPPKKTADQILNEYEKFKSGKGKDDAIHEVVQGIKEYFDVMLGAQLLYKFERIQYADILSSKPDTPMCQVYGAMHLLRLFVKIGGMLAYTNLDEKSMQTLVNHLHDFLKYVEKNATDLLSLEDYIVASPEYQRKAI